MSVDRRTWRTARGRHECWSCGRTIERRERYLEHVEFPGPDASFANEEGHPVQRRECQRCAEAPPP